MTRLLSAAVAAVLLAALSAPADDKSARTAGPRIGHMVYFKLKDGTPAAREKLVASCDKYLAGQDGVAFYSAGVVAEGFKQEVNDRDWDVALHVVFDGKAAHDKYQVHPDHVKFVAENKDTWAKVRVFDSELAAAKTGKKITK